VLFNGILLLAAGSGAGEVAVPGIGHVVTDGNAGDWAEDGFHIDVMGDITGRVKAPDDFNSTCRLAWTSQGLAVLLNVMDSTLEEQSDPQLAMLMDAVRITVSNPEDVSDAYAVVITPGTAPEHPEPRWHFIDRRKVRERELTVSVGRLRTDAGYQMEVVLPWANMGADLRKGDRVGFHIQFSDNDFPESLANFCFNAQWPATKEAAVLKLARSASSPVLIVADAGRLDEFADVQIGLSAPAQLAGQSVALKRGSKTIARGEWSEAAGRAACTLSYPLGDTTHPLDELRVVVDGEIIGAMPAPNEQALRMQALRDVELAFAPSVFNWPTFPECRLREPLRLRKLIGPYTVNTTFYDKSFSPVDVPVQAGRYGAVVEIIPEHGQPIRRFRTLVYLPEGAAFWDFETPGATDTLAWPEALGLEGDLARDQQAGLARQARQAMVNGFFNNDGGARFLAGLMGLQGHPERSAMSPVTLTDQWWVDFKRRYYGQQEPVPVLRPQETDEPAGALRFGTSEEAGMDPAEVERIRSLCREWARDGEEPFSVCLARNGVVFLHEGFGSLCGAPMSADEPRAIASVYKLIEAVVVMMLVDQGVLDLDAPIATYLPALKAADPGCAITLRHLFTHTSGLEGHWGWDQSDQEEVVADYCASLQPGERFDYGSTGYVLAERIVEAVTGTAFASLQAQCLNAPLGLAPMGDDPARMNSIDLARVAQMLLNGGAYGSQRFLSPESCAAMTPRPLTRELGEMTEITWGIGTRAFYEVPSSLRTWGQSGASGTFVCIDPDNQLVVVMARSRDGKDVMKHRAVFLDAIAKAVRTGAATSRSQ
jgi:CubicO group peptidase (beta-lactamase class C family)